MCTCARPSAGLDGAALQDAVLNGIGCTFAQLHVRGSVRAHNMAYEPTLDIHLCTKITHSYTFAWVNVRTYWTHVGLGWDTHMMYAPALDG